MIDLKEEMTFEQRLEDKGASHSRLQHVWKRKPFVFKGRIVETPQETVENSSQKKCRECWEPRRLELRSQHFQSTVSASLPFSFSPVTFCVCMSVLVCRVCGVSSLSLYQLRFIFSSCMWIFSMKWNHDLRHLTPLQSSNQRGAAVFLTIPSWENLGKVFNWLILKHVSIDLSLWPRGWGITIDSACTMDSTFFGRGSSFPKRSKWKWIVLVRKKSPP